MSDVEKPDMDLDGESEDKTVTLPEKSQDDARNPVGKFVHEHPVITVAGGLAIGVLAAALIPSKARNKMITKASDWSGVASAAVLAIAREALDKAESARDDIGRQAETLGDNVSMIGGLAADKASETGQVIARKVSEIGSKLGR